MPLAADWYGQIRSVGIIVVDSVGRDSDQHREDTPLDQRFPLPGLVAAASDAPMLSTAIAAPTITPTLAATIHAGNGLRRYECCAPVDLGDDQATEEAVMSALFALSCGHGVSTSASTHARLPSAAQVR